MKDLFFILSVILFSSPYLRANKTYNVFPLNSAAERAVINSPLKKYLTRPGSDQMDFQRKVLLAIQRISSQVKINSEPRFFIYDCLFLDDMSLAQHYPQMTKRDLKISRAVVQGVFN